MKLSEKAAEIGEVPVSTVLCSVDINGNSENLSEKSETWTIIASSANQVIDKSDPTAHSEILAIREAARISENERLNDLIMITTLEPCLMCTGAIILARLNAVYFFAPTRKGPGMREILNNSRSGSHFNHYPDVIHLEKYEKRAAELLKDFFKIRR